MRLDVMLVVLADPAVCGDRRGSGVAHQNSSISIPLLEALLAFADDVVQVHYGGVWQWFVSHAHGLMVARAPVGASPHSTTNRRMFFGASFSITSTSTTQPR